VVRHLEDVRAQVDAGGEDARLGGRAQVAGEQDPEPAVGDPQDEREVVRLGEGGGLVRGRRQDLDAGPAHGSPVAGDEDGPLRLRPPDHAVERGPPIVGRRERAGRHHTDIAAVEGSRQPGHVVGVQM
jgi:hypothetical protein